MLKFLKSQKTINFFHLVSAVIANIFYGFPSRKLKVIGVTGTNGKTTTCHLITTILETAGEKVGMTTTIDFKFGDEVIENNYKMTTLSPFALQKMLKKMVANNCSFAVIEVTSIALDQHRLWGVPFYAAVFTNLTHDHLDYHGSMSRYLVAKEKMFERRPYLSVLNADDPTIERLSKYDCNKLVTYGIKNPATIIAKKLYARPGGVDFILLIDGKQTSVSLPLPGEFNVYNALAAIAVGLGLGNSLDTVMEGVRRFEPVAGRMEVVDAGQPFTVLIDYAHTPDALQNVYETLIPTVRGRLISVLGATGRRDRTKRPILGAIAARYADYVIVTNEDPYDEDPLTIIDEVASGVVRGRPKGPGRYKINKESDVPIKYKDSGEDIWWWRVPDRKDAINKALKLARAQDVVLVTGKGAEKVMAVGDKLIPFSDREVLIDLLRKYRVS
ncbi:UDP-N-acetylmuramoyl-L-alanyl-D-glutamate--2,6-diaminopimelate ligase [Candidatus Berkelbacteria bacterium]|nr:UDP-N-acetylmuramoyl-L-alanyl-D-glutamate--2,6-diaminopimelate ligase [Candidatus Berkelbacteria bacterium]